MWLAIGLNVAFNFSFCGAITVSALGAQGPSGFCIYRADHEGLTFFSSNALNFKVLVLPQVLGLNASLCAIRTCRFGLVLIWLLCGNLLTARLRGPLFLSAFVTLVMKIVFLISTHVSCSVTVVCFSSDSIHPTEYPNYGC